jgi:hypothetical protein
MELARQRPEAWPGTGAHVVRPRGAPPERAALCRRSMASASGLKQQCRSRPPGYRHSYPTSDREMALGSIPDRGRWGIVRPGRGVPPATGPAAVWLVVDVQRH